MRTVEEAEDVQLEHYVFENVLRWKGRVEAVEPQALSGLTSVQKGSERA
jgi:hypothetical protein